MPAAIPAIGAAFVANAVGVAVGSQIFGAFVGAVASGVLGRALSPKPQNFEAIAQGVLANTASNIAGLPVVYGSRRIGGHRVFTERSGDKHEFLHLVFALAEGEISAINTVYLDNIASTNGRFSGLVTLEKKVGTDTQAASSALISATGGRWSSAHQGKGVAYLYVKLKYNKDAFSTGLPAITADIDGKLVYDPRDGTTKFSNNPALCILDYLQNSRYGRSIPGTYDPVRLNLPGTLGNYASTPGSAALDAISALDIRVKLAMDDWTPGIVKRFVTKRGTTTSWDFFMESHNRLALYTGTAGWPSATAAVPFADGETGWIRVTRRVSDARVQFFTSTDGVTWTQLGTDMTDSTAGALVITDERVDIGQLFDGSLWAGKVYYAEIRNGIDGDVVAKFDPDADSKSGQTEFDSSTGETWTINGSAAYLSGGSSGRINFASFIAAANHCAEELTLPDATTQARYTCDGIVNPDNGWLENLKQLLTSCRGSLIFSGGQYRLHIDKEETAKASGFTEDNIVGSWEIKNAGKRDKSNRVRAQFFNPERDWQPDFATWDDTTHRTADNELVLEHELQLPFTADFHRAQRIAQLHEKISRFGITASFKATAEAMRFEVGDVVPITHSTPGWVAKPFRILSMQPLPTEEWQIAVREYQAAAYDLDGLDDTPVIPSTNLPDLSTVTAPSNIQLFSGTSELFVAGDGTVVSRIRVTWDAPTEQFVLDGGRTEIQFMEFAGSPAEWSPSLFFDGSITFAHVSPVEDGRQYIVRIRHENTIGTKSSWTTSSAHTVIGKTELPSNVSGFSAVQQGSVVLFDTDRVADADLDSIEIRFVEVDGTWEDASPLCNILRGETDTSAALQPGTWDVLAKAKDTSGNYSDGEARVRLTVTASGFTSIASQEESPKWLGTRTNMVQHHTGVLTPDSQSLASALDWEVFDEFVPNAFTDCYYEGVAIDKSIDATARVWSDIVSVLGPGETTGIAHPKLEIDTRLDAGSFDGFEPWTVGSANFRHLKARLHVDTSIGKPVVSGFEINVDNEARTEEFKQQAIGSSGTAITFATPFHAVPVIQITPVGTTALIPSAENPSTTGFTAHLYNTSGAGAAGTANIAATGV